MVSTTCYVATGTDDWDDSSATNTTIQTFYNFIVTPAVSRDAYADITTSTIPASATITAASLLFRIDGAILIGKGTKQFVVSMWNGSGWTAIYGSYTPTVGLVSIPLNATQIGWINTAGKTSFKYTCSATSGSSITIDIRAYETLQTQASRLNITYTLPSTKKVGKSFSRLRRGIVRR